MILVTGAAGLFGITALAAYGIASRLDYILIPLLFGLCTAVLTMVGVNMGAGQVARAKQIAWTGSFVGAGIAGTIGLVIAVFPMLWLQLFSHDPHVLAAGSTYLRIVAPVYGAFGFGFVLSFAAQGAGHVLWPFVGATSRLVIAAGCGWIATFYLSGGIAALASMVSASQAAYAAICTIAMMSGAVWRSGKA